MCLLTLQSNSSSSSFIVLRQYLGAAGASVADPVEITTYHVDLRKHLGTFVAVKDAHLARPFPAWSAIGVSHLITHGALVELRAIAEAPAPTADGRA